MGKLSRAHLKSLAATPIFDTIPSIELEPALKTPPFIRAPLLNLRDLGTVPNSGLRPDIAFRSGGLQDDDDTKEWLSENVKRVFDLRYDPEIQRHPDPVAKNVDNVRLPLNGHPMHLDLTEFADDDGAAGWAKHYLYYMDLFAPQFKAVLEHVRDTGEPFLFHCTAGRDRTGVLAGILHHLAGTPSEDIVYDYILSRVGLEPARDMLVTGLRKNLTQEQIDSMAFANMASLRASYWEAFEEGVTAKYGSWEAYVRKLGFTDDCIVRIKTNLTAAK